MTSKVTANTCQEPSGIYVKFSTMRASRLMSILLLLQNRGRLTADQLAAHFEVSVRTIYRDIDQLSAAEVPVYADRGPGGGFQLLDGYRTKLTGLSSAEAETLFIAGLPGPAAEMGLADALATAQLKLTAALPEGARANARRLSARFHLDPVDWFRSAASARLLPAIATAVWGETSIDVRYKRADSDNAVARRLQPLGLVLKAGTWYVVAAVGESVRTYRVSNILDLSATSERFTRPKDFDLVRFWTASSRAYEVGLYRGTAQLRVSKRGMARLEALGATVLQAAQDSAEPEKSGGWTRVTIPIESIDHAAFDMLKLGSEAEVLKPSALRRRVAKTARDVAQLNT
jgi:predicted DNA-binding transcriptional regulator YafY